MGSLTMSTVSCSVCLDAVKDVGGGERSIAKLKCGHLFHLGGRTILREIVDPTTIDTILFVQGRGACQLWLENQPLNPSAIDDTLCKDYFGFTKLEYEDLTCTRSLYVVVFNACNKYDFAILEI
ncbi:hypothetical protein O6H91_17G087100 [Diphasiastrum complanatum]|uniref:Uncharacterized protein n=1 Tax=Diphasiastrum complanatum TaxID=34168 RepID=A0ACC2B8S5_DIPCM|nr:hypothetical protein O6H91_17G087100 [Diphasiastrum complanatum]